MEFLEGGRWECVRRAGVDLQREADVSTSALHTETH